MPPHCKTTSRRKRKQINGKREWSAEEKRRKRIDDKGRAGVVSFFFLSLSLDSFFSLLAFSLRATKMRASSALLLQARHGAFSSSPLMRPAGAGDDCSLRQGSGSVPRRRRRLSIAVAAEGGGKKKGFGAPAAKPPPADLKKVREAA